MNPQCAVCDRPLIEGKEWEGDVTASGRTKPAPIEPVIRCESCEALCCATCVAPKEPKLCAPCCQCDGCGQQFAFEDLREWTDSLRAGALSTRLWLCRPCRKTRISMVAA